MSLYVFVARNLFLTNKAGPLFHCWKMGSYSIAFVISFACAAAALLLLLLLLLGC